MRRLLALTVLYVLLTGRSAAQSGTVIPQGGAGHAAQASCVILKRMGPADQVTSHLYSFGVRGKQFQYVEGKLPEGLPFHGRLTDHDVRNLQGRGAEVIVLSSSYTAEELKQARDDCRGETGKSPNQAEPKAIASQAGTPTANTSGMAAGTNVQAEESAQGKATTPQGQPAAEANITRMSVTSSPVGADIEVDGAFVGNTPSTIDVAGGDHTVVVSKNGYKSWERKLKASGGNVNLNFELETAAK